MAIRYDRKINQEIDSVVRRFNNKVKRLERANRDLDLPITTSKEELMKEVNNRQQLKRKLAELERFTQRGAEKTITTAGGVKITRWELDNIERESKRLKSYLTRRINTLSNITPTIGGVKQYATLAQMGSQQIANLKARRTTLNKNFKKLSKDEFRRYRSVLNKTGQKQQYRTQIFMDNYIEKMLNGLAYYVGYDKDKIENIKNKLLKLDEKTFLKLFDTEKAISDIVDYYPEIHKNSIEDVKQEVFNLYDTLNENLDSIIADYVK